MSSSSDHVSGLCPLIHQAAQMVASKLVLSTGKTRRADPELRRKEWSLTKFKVFGLSLERSVLGFSHKRPSRAARDSTRSIIRAVPLLKVGSLAAALLSRKQRAPAKWGNSGPWGGGHRSLFTEDLRDSARSHWGVSRLRTARPEVGNRTASTPIWASRPARASSSLANRSRKAAVPIGSAIRILLPDACTSRRRTGVTAPRASPPGMAVISAAHATMPIPSYARVTNSGNGRSLIVRVNDRGPYHPGRIIDLSSRAAEMLDVRRAGTALVRVEYVGPAPLEGSDDRKLIATLREGMPEPTPSNVMLASAKPFVPEITTTTPSRRTAAAGLSAPLDPDHRERAEDIVASRSGPWANSDRSAGLREISATTRPVASASGSAPRSHGSVPVSAYAPGQYDGGTGVTTGRGLY